MLLFLVHAVPTAALGGQLVLKRECWRANPEREEQRVDPVEPDTNQRAGPVLGSSEVRNLSEQEAVNRRCCFN